MTKKINNNLIKYIAVFIVACFSFFCFADYVVDCERDKADALSRLDSSIYDCTLWLNDTPHYFAIADSLREQISYVYDTYEPKNSTGWLRAINSLYGYADSVSNYVVNATNQVTYSKVEAQFIRQYVSTIDCVDCTSSNTCCCCDWLPSVYQSITNIENRVSSVSFSISSISNSLIDIISSLHANTNILFRINAILGEQFLYTGAYMNGPDFVSSFVDSYLNDYYFRYFKMPFYYPDTDPLVRDMLEAITYNLADGLASLNNYFYFHSLKQFPSYADHMTNNIITLTESSTNFFSFFVSSTTSRPVLSDYNGLDFPSYHAYLTNFYINVAEGNTAHFTSIQKANTNWFGRIETLIASLVFADSQTNPIDNNSSVYEDMAREFSDKSTQFKDDLTGLVNSPVGNTQSAVDSLRSLSRAFTDASMPEEVNLVSIPLPDGTQDIKFNPSGSGASAFRCVSTVVWVFTALFLVVQFIWFSFRAISHIVIFIWDVLSMIFGGGT